MLNWIRELALPPMARLMPHGAGRASPVVAAGPTLDWLAVAAAPLQALARGPQWVTLFAPTDAALRQAGVSPQHLPPVALQQWLARHLSVVDDPTAAVLPMLDGSLLRRDSTAGWRDASGQRVGQLRAEAGPGDLRLLWVDRPLQPASANLWQQLAAEPGLGRFADALERTGLSPLLGCTGPFTVLAPSDAGLDRAAARLGLSRLALWSDNAQLGRLLRQHVVPGRWSSLDLPWGGQLRSWADTPLHLSPLGHVRAGGDLAQPLAAGSDQPCSNGVLHRLRDALLPQD